MIVKITMAHFFWYVTMNKFLLWPLKELLRWRIMHICCPDNSRWKCKVPQNLNLFHCLYLFCSCDKVYHKHVRFLLYLLGQIVSWHDWQLGNCPFPMVLGPSKVKPFPFVRVDVVHRALCFYLYYLLYSPQVNTCCHTFYCGVVDFHCLWFGT